MQSTFLLFFYDFISKLKPQNKSFISNFKQRKRIIIIFNKFYYNKHQRANIIIIIIAKKVVFP